jgi:hypothetical protein
VYIRVFLSLLGSLVAYFVSVLPHTSLPSGRDLVMSQIDRFLKLVRFYNTDLPECNDVMMAGGGARNVAPTLQQCSNFADSIKKCD